MASRYAMVVVVEARDASEAWEDFASSYTEGMHSVNSADVQYVGAPWVVPIDDAEDHQEYSTEELALTINGETARLYPAD